MKSALAAAASATTSAFNYGLIACDYAKFRKPFPDHFFTNLRQRGLIGPGKKILDLGAGTGATHRGIAKIEPQCQITALDCAQDMLTVAAREDKEIGLTNITYHCSPAEKTGLPDHHFDLIIAARCWHWFDEEAALKEIERISKPDAALVITHFDPTLEDDNPLDIVRKLIQGPKYDPTWKLPIKAKLEREDQYMSRLMSKGFKDVELQAFPQRELVPQNEWVGFFNTTSGIGGNKKLTSEQKESLNKEHAQALKEKYGDSPLEIRYCLSSIFSRVPNKNSIEAKKEKASPKVDVGAPSLSKAPPK